MTLSSNKIIAVIPAFNEAKTVRKVVSGLRHYCDEIIVVNDCSTDTTKYEAENAGAVVVNHTENRGYDASIEDGFREASKRGAGIIVTFDADGQHNPEDLKKLTDIIASGQADVAIGQRQTLTHPAEKVFAWYTNIFFGIKDPLCGLKAYQRKVCEAIGHFDTISSIGTQLTIQAVARGFKVAKVPIVINERQDESRFYYRKIRANIKILKALARLMLLRKK